MLTLKKSGHWLLILNSLLETSDPSKLPKFLFLPCFFNRHKNWYCFSLIFVCLVKNLEELSWIVIIRNDFLLFSHFFSQFHQLTKACAQIWKGLEISKQIWKLRNNNKQNCSFPLWKIYKVPGNCVFHGISLA